MTILELLTNSYSVHCGHSGPVLFDWSDLISSVFLPAAGKKEQTDRVRPAKKNGPSELMIMQWASIVNAAVKPQFVGTSAGYQIETALKLNCFKMKFEASS